MKFPYTKDEVTQALNTFSQHKEWGLCGSFSTTTKDSAYIKIPYLLKKLGGKPRSKWFWTEPSYYYWNDKEKKQEEQARNQRATMLAFMLAWADDPDFGV